MNQVWIKFKSSLNQVWIEFESSSNPIWIQFESSLNPVLIKFNSSLNQVRIQFESSSNPVWIMFEYCIKNHKLSSMNQVWLHLNHNWIMFESQVIILSRFWWIIWILKFLSEYYWNAFWIIFEPSFESHGLCFNEIWIKIESWVDSIWIVLNLIWIMFWNQFESRVIFIQCILMEFTSHLNHENWESSFNFCFESWEIPIWIIFK